MTHKERYEITERLIKLGFTYDEAQQIRRIAMTLHRWAELECGDSNNYASWAIERDETTDIPYMVRHPYNGKSYRTRIPDRENGAKRRLEKLLKGKSLIPYYQSDPRGCALYLLRPGDVPDGEDVSRYYNRGIAVY